MGPVICPLPGHSRKKLNSLCGQEDPGSLAKIACGNIFDSDRFLGVRFCATGNLLFPLSNKWFRIKSFESDFALNPQGPGQLCLEMVGRVLNYPQQARGP